MMDVQKAPSSSAVPFLYPQELASQYDQVAANLSIALKIEADRSDSVDYEEELKTLKIRIQYPIQLERISNFNTVIIRHAFSLHNFFKRAFSFDDRRIYSSELIDPPLIYFGKRQCEYLRQFVHTMDFSVVLISPLLRTVQTAQLLFNDHPNKKNIKFMLNPLATEKISSGVVQLLQKKSKKKYNFKTNKKNPDQIQIDFSAFDDFKNKEQWQLELTGDSNYRLEGLTHQEQQERFFQEQFVKHGKRVSIETEEQCYRRGQRLKAIMQEAVKMNQGTNKKVCLVSHSVLIKTLFAKGLDSNKNIIKDPNFYLENGNLTAVNF